MSIFEESKSYRPFKYPDVMVAAQKHAIDMFWDVHEVNLQDDIQQYFSSNGLATQDVSHEQNKAILDATLSLFTEMDKSVGGGYIKLLQYIKNNEHRCRIITHASREVVHQRAYALAAETFGFNDDDWVRFADYKEMVDKIEVMGRQLYDEGWSTPMKAAVLTAQIGVGEGVGLFGPFAILLNLKRFGKVIGFNDINAWSLIDETDHVNENINLLNTIKMESLTEDEIKIVNDVICKFLAEFEQAEHRYLELVFQMGGSQDLTLDQMKGYITWLKDLRAFQFGVAPTPPTQPNPLPWMDWFLESGKHANFFEKKVQEYSHAKMKGEIDYNVYTSLIV